MVKQIAAVEKTLQEEMTAKEIADAILTEMLKVEASIIFHLELKASISQKQVLASLEEILKAVAQGKQLSAEKGVPQGQLSLQEAQKIQAFEQIQQAVFEYTETFTALNQQMMSSKGLALEEQAAFEKTFDELQVRIQEPAIKISDLSRQKIQTSLRQIEQYSLESRLRRERARRDVILIAMLSFLIGGGLVIALAQRLIRPLRQITKIIRQVEVGDAEVQAPVTEKSEIGQLAQAVNHFLKEFNTYDALKTLRIREQAHLLEMVCHLSGIGLLILDIDGQILFFSERILHLTEREKDQLFGKPIEEVLIDASLVRFLRKALRDRSPVAVTDFSVKRKDGAYIPVEIHVGIFETEAVKGAKSVLVIIRNQQYAPGQLPVSP
jgi:PAS domain S-box-containing protein